MSTMRELVSEILRRMLAEAAAAEQAAAAGATAAVAGGAATSQNPDQSQKRSRRGTGARRNMTAHTLSKGVRCALAYIEATETRRTGKVGGTRQNGDGNKNEDDGGDLDTPDHALELYDTAHTALATVLALSRTRVRTIPFQMVDGGVLRAYTDASLLLSALDLVSVGDGGGTGDADADGGAGVDVDTDVDTDVTGEESGQESGEGRNGHKRSRTDAGTGPALSAIERDREGCRKRVRTAIRRLDMAIIVAGAVGPGRMGWVQRVMRGLQGCLESESGRARKRARVAGAPCISDRVVPSSSSSAPASAPDPAPSSSPSAPPASLTGSNPFTPSPFAPTPIPSLPPPALDSPPSSPYILRAYLANNTHHPRWRALDRWGSLAYLLDRVGDGRVVPVEIGTSYDAEGWGQRIVPFEDFLRGAGWGDDRGGQGRRDQGRARGGPKDANNHDHPPNPTPTNFAETSASTAPPQYLAQHALFAQFPQLESDLSVPEYVWADAPEGYSPPPDVLVNVWMGPGGRVVSPAHTDPFYNCYAQVLGRKRVWLAPPSAAVNMYAYGGDKASDADDADNEHERKGQDEQADTLASEYMTNTSRVPILQDVNDDEGAEALRARFPRFFDRVYPAAMEAVLEPGDLLVMPPGWWHAMRGEGEGVCWSVSFWY